MSTFVSSCSPPIGFRFDPTDEELVSYYLQRKIKDGACFDFIEDMDVYSKEPWMLPHKNSPFFKEHQWYYFVKRARSSGKNGNGKRPKRTIDGDLSGGCWKATEGDKFVVSNTGQIVGLKKSLTFFTNKKKNGSDRAGVKSNWLMKEYRLHSDLFQDWVLCKIRQKISTKNTIHGITASPMVQEHGVSNVEVAQPLTLTNGSFVGGYLRNLIPLVEVPNLPVMQSQTSCASVVDSDGLSIEYGQTSSGMLVENPSPDQEYGWLDDALTFVTREGSDIFGYVTNEYPITEARNVLASAGQNWGVSSLGSEDLAAESANIFQGQTVSSAEAILPLTLPNNSNVGGHLPNPIPLAEAPYLSGMECQSSCVSGADAGSLNMESGQKDSTHNNVEETAADQELRWLDDDLVFVTDDGEILLSFATDEIPMIEAPDVPAMEVRGALAFDSPSLLAESTKMAANNSDDDWFEDLNRLLNRRTCQTVC